MARIAFDTRLVQTAVIGSKDSEQPIILPMEPDDLEVHRRRYPNYTYYCGVQLGGCGGQLADRLYRDGRVCHFAHHPDSDGTHPACYRTATGEDSADHLFIKRGVIRMLSKQTVRGEVTLLNLGRGPGDGVDIHLPDTRSHIRFHLTPGLDVPAWRQADEDLTEKADTVDWVLTHESPVAQELLSRHGYCLRVRCETDGAERRVHIGTQRAGRHQIHWTPLEDCTLTSTGLLTPATGSLHLTRAQPKPAGFVLQGEPVFTVSKSDSLTQDSFPFALTTQHRRVILADVKPAGSQVVRAFISLPNDVPVLSPGNVYRLTGVIRLLVTDPDKTTGAQWALTADKVVLLNVDEAQRTGLWAPPPPSPPASPAKVPPRPPETERKHEVRKTEPDRHVLVAARGQGRSTQNPAVTRLRAALERVAQLRSSTTWEALIGMASLDVAHLADPVRRSLLIAVDEPITEARPLLSVLVRERNGKQLSYMGTILKMHGLNVPGGEESLRRWCTRETERAYAAYSNPPRSVPPRLGTEPENRPRPQVISGARRQEPGNQIPSAKAKPKGVLEQSLARLEARIEEARQVLDQTTSPARRKQLARTIRRAQAELNSYRKALKAGTAHMKWLSGNGKSPRDYDLLLQGAMKAAQKTPKGKRNPRH